MEPNTNLYSLNENSGIIRENSQKILSVLAAHEIALWEYDIPTGKCSFTDDYFRTLGLKDAGIIFKDIDDFYRFAHPDDIDTYQKNFAEMLDSESKTSQMRVRCVGEHGEVIWLEDHFLSHRGSIDEGHPDKLLAYTVNVTLQCEKEQQIKRLETYNRKIIEALPEFIFIFDDNFYITDVLMAPDTILLHPIDVLKGVNARNIYSPEVSDLFICNIRECLKDGKLKEIEYPLEVDGRKFYFQARIAPFESNKVLALIHDIGDRIRRSQELIEAKRRAEDADRMKSVFLANMSHEIRTPLNAIVGFSEIMAVTVNEEEKHEYLEIIQKNSNLLLQLINDILDLSRIESGKSEMHFQQVEISGLIDEVEKVHQLKMKSNVELKIIRPQEEFWTSTDRNRVMQVLFNFLSNAIKNTERGSITLGLKHEGDWLNLFVSDTGCGISEEKLPRIFTRFEKLNDFVQGTGLGLSICKSIVERLGGKIEVTSELGKGSTFSLYLPYLEVPREVAERIITSKKDSQFEQHKKILIVEDIESNFAQLNILLKKEYTILWVRNGQEAVNSFIREKPDLILMDIRMPVMDGIQATEKIRTISLSVPIIAVTAYAFYTEQQQAIQAGCNAVISKPYSLERLKETIESYIG
ncbi:ATP-binding protein [Bacteroides sp.]|uniref:PAS domain-containing hybrid sensor histidine kinase/response regulator n=1 Tax=Bacteroides sp. TaxID=29523 RepID=UPI00261D1939|nr:ATP-binding protein [Bacteroides sp.]MDD3037333.1 ATP-binding protein [Bacteroides sp.]